MGGGLGGGWAGAGWALMGLRGCGAQGCPHGPARGGSGPLQPQVSSVSPCRRKNAVMRRCLRQPLASSSSCQRASWLRPSPAATSTRWARAEHAARALHAVSHHTNCSCAARSCFVPLAAVGWQHACVPRLDEISVPLQQCQRLNSGKSVHSVSCPPSMQPASAKVLLIPACFAAVTFDDASKNASGEEAV